MNTHVHLCYLAQFFLEWTTLQKKKLKKKSDTYFIIRNFLNENSGVYKILWKDTVQPQNRWQYDACVKHAGHLKPQTHTQNMQYLLLFHCKNR